MQKKFFALCIAVIVIFFLIFFIRNNYNFLTSGNNMSNKSAEEIKNYILNMNSFKAEATVTITSNKTTNTYKLMQQFKENQFKQELLEPNNISGLTIIYDGTNLKVENTRIGLSKLYENYKYITDNSLCITTFINEYLDEKNEHNMNIENDTIVLQVKVKNQNIYTSNKKLYIDKNNATPIKMEILDDTQNLKVYIQYNKVEINTLQKEIVAFETEKNKEMI